MTRRLALRVDPDLCVGNAMCRAALPDVFVEAPNRQSLVVSAPPTPAAALEAAADCPVGAILVEDADTREPIDF
jgi:ferredoxin